MSDFERIGKRIVTKTEEATCEEHGATFTRSFVKFGNHASFDHWSGSCPACAEEHDKRCEENRREMREREHRQLVHGLRQKANIPLRFKDARFASFIPGTKKQAAALRIAERYASEFAKNLETGKCLTFLGSVGTGKTLLSCAILISLIESGFSVEYTTAAEIIREIRNSWNFHAGQTTTEVIKQFTAPALLVVDEVGVGLGSESEIAQLTEVFDLRYRAQRSTLVVSNLDRDGLIEALGERAVDRLAEADGAIALFDGKSHRGKSSRLQDAPSATELTQ